MPNGERGKLLDGHTGGGLLGGETKERDTGDSTGDGGDDPTIDGDGLFSHHLRVAVGLAPLELSRVAGPGLHAAPALLGVLLAHADLVVEVKGDNRSEVSLTTTVRYWVLVPGQEASVLPALSWTWNAMTYLPT